MPATFVDLESDLVEKAAAIKEPDQTIAAFVRNLIEKEHRAWRLRESAQRYEQFLRDNPDEREALEVWESAPFER
jgi:hypothetical protein